MTTIVTVDADSGLFVTDAAPGNPQAYVQMRAGHSQGAITERYIHAAQVLFPGAAERPRPACSGAPGSKSGSKRRAMGQNEKSPVLAGLF